MAQTTPPNTADAGLELTTHFVRSRNAVVASADFGDLYVDYYLHLSDHGMKPKPEHDQLFKRALAGFVLHCASRPWNELTAWTINFQDPLLNVFLVGDNDTGAVAGRVFEENVRSLPSAVFYADVVRGSEPTRRSAVEFSGSDPLVAIESFYLQSEQRTARLFQTGEEHFTMVSEHPDCDVAWLKALTVDAARGLAQGEVLAPLERRIYRWHCGCTLERMMDVLMPTMRKDPALLFGDADSVEIRCPRCGGRYGVSRHVMAERLSRAG